MLQEELDKAKKQSVTAWNLIHIRKFEQIQPTILIADSITHLLYIVDRLKQIRINIFQISKYKL
jgi:hypothetical protein